MAASGAAAVELCVAADMGAIGKAAIVDASEADLWSHKWMLL